LAIIGCNFVIFEWIVFKLEHKLIIFKDSPLKELDRPWPSLINDLDFEGQIIEIYIFWLLLAVTLLFLNGLSSNLTIIIFKDSPLK
jgi:hypothetical protein